MRTCHYVVLDIDKNASESDIKKAYRRKALEWHPGETLPPRAFCAVIKVFFAFSTTMPHYRALINRYRLSFFPFPFRQEPSQS
jgi:hypothetical protein